jgi:hypothetical protein
VMLCSDRNEHARDPNGDGDSGQQRAAPFAGQNRTVTLLTGAR